jgi:hypothetical protein
LFGYFQAYSIFLHAHGDNKTTPSRRWSPCQPHYKLGSLESTFGTYLRALAQTKKEDAMEPTTHITYDDAVRQAVSLLAPQCSTTLQDILVACGEALLGGPERSEAEGKWKDICGLTSCHASIRHAPPSTLPAHAPTAAGVDAAKQLVVCQCHDHLARLERAALTL